MIKIGLIGGSGLDNPAFLENALDKKVTTPYGEPSSPLRCGSIKGVAVIFIARHGREHTIPPSQVNYRANIAALEREGCTHIFATTAVGSLKEEIRRGDLIILDQFIDATRKRESTFHETFTPHNPIHCPMAHPFSEELRTLLIKTCEKLGFSHHKRGTVITIEGPRFSTLAESKMFQQFGDVINMTTATECILANELGIPYAAVAMITDYDCWKEDEAPVTWEEIRAVFEKNTDKVLTLLRETIPLVKE